MCSYIFAATRCIGILVVVLSMTYSRAQAQACLSGAWLPGVNHTTSGFSTAQICTNGTFPSPLFNAVHMALIPQGLYRGRVLVWDYVQGCVGQRQRWSLLNVSATAWPPTFQNYDLSMPSGQGDLFCAGHAWTKEGLLFVAGGTTQWPPPNFVGANLAYLFNPALIQAQGTANAGNAPWLQQPSMSGSRWYPTVTLLGGNPPGAAPGQDDNTLIVSGGTDQLNAPRNDYEVFDSTFALPMTGSWRTYVTPPSTTPSQILFGPTFSPNYLALDSYPRMFVLSDGSIFMAGV